MKNALQAGLTYGPAADPEAGTSAKDLEILERSSGSDSVNRSETEKHKLRPSPINSAWILEGNPIARNKLLSASTDGMASTYIWDCTAGRFNWYYDLDETVYVLEGSFVIKDAAGVRRQLSAGDTHLFQAGTHSEWTVASYVRKVAFCRVPMSKKILRAKQLYQTLRRLFGRSAAGNGSPASPLG